MGCDAERKKNISLFNEALSVHRFTCINSEESRNWEGSGGDLIYGTTAGYESLRNKDIFSAS